MNAGNFNEDIAAKLLHLASLKQDWDSYGAPPIDKRACIAAISILATLMMPPHGVVPTSKGGVQLEWHDGGRDIEIEIGPDGDIAYD